MEWSPAGLLAKVFLTMFTLTGCGTEASDYEGLWSAQRSHGESSCTGPYDFNLPGFTIRLREGGSADLEYVSLDSQDLTKELCVQSFSVDGDTATMTGVQTCTFEFPDVDPQTGEPTTTEQVQTFTKDTLVLDGDAIHETGAVEYETPDGTCTDSFNIDFERL